MNNSLDRGLSQLRRARERFRAAGALEVAGPGARDVSGAAARAVKSRCAWMASTRSVARTPFVFIGNNEYHVEGFKLGGRARLDGACCIVTSRRRCARDNCRSCSRTRCSAWRQRAWLSLCRGTECGSTRRSRAVERRVRRRGVDARHAAPLSIVAGGARRARAPDTEAMRTIVHLSDLHFGRLDERIIAPLVERITADRARSDRGVRRSDAARPPAPISAGAAFLDRLPSPRSSSRAITTCRCSTSPRASSIRSAAIAATSAATSSPPLSTTRSP